jgi:hypothetical protein
MNNGSIKKIKFNWTDTVSKNIHNFVDASINNKDYLFTDNQKYQNIAILDAIKRSSSEDLIIKVE